MTAVARMNGSRSYRMCGLTLASCQELPGAGDGGCDGPDVMLSYADVPERLDPVTGHGPNWEAAQDTLLLRIPGVARLLIRDGREVRIEPAQGSQPADLGAFLTGSVLGALLHQRGYFVLHASAVAVDGAAAIFCGASGSGKSVLAAALGAAGHGWIADDICRIDTSSGTPLVIPDGAQMKLWSDSIAGLSLEGQARAVVRSGIEKFRLDPPGARLAGALPVRNIYFLHALRSSLQVGIRPVAFLDALSMLRTHGYRRRLIRAFGREQAWLEASVRLAQHAAAWHLTRMVSFDALGGCVRMLQDHWSR